MRIVARQGDRGEARRDGQSKHKSDDVGSALRRGGRSVRSAVRTVGGVIRDTYRQALHADIPIVASGLAYITLASFLPLLVVSFVIFRSFGGISRLLDTVRPILDQNLAESARDEVLIHIQAFLQGMDISAVSIGGLLALIVTSMALFTSIEVAINRVWHTRINRSVFHRVAVYWLCLTLGPLVLAVAVGITTSNTLSLRGVLPQGVLGWGLSILIFVAIYKYVPDRPVFFFPALAASLFTTTLWQVARNIYLLYTSNVAGYSKIYGSLAAVVILVAWLYIAWVIVLVGAALSAAIQKRIEARAALDAED